MGTSFGDEVALIIPFYIIFVTSVARIMQKSQLRDKHYYDYAQSVQIRAEI